MSKGIADILKRLRNHVDLWANLSSRIDDRAKDGEHGNRSERFSLAEWRAVEGIYEKYASDVSLPR